MRTKIQNVNPDFKNFGFTSNTENYSFEKDGLQLKSSYTSEDSEAFKSKGYSAFAMIKNTASNAWVCERRLAISSG